MPQARQQAQIALRFFVIERWVLLGLIALGWTLQVIGPTMFRQIVSWFPPQPEPIGTGVVVVVLAVVNVLTSRLILARGRATTTIAGAHLLLDAAAMTALLALSGGVTNAFSTMYFVPMTLATQLSPRWTWAIGGACLLGFASLFVFAQVPAGPPGHEAHFLGHIRGMWVAFGMSAAFMIYFVHRIALSLARQQAELERLRIAAQQDRQLAALGTLAAGAAHELGSPLGTIGVLVGDLQYMDAKEQAEAIATIKQEMGRCKHILLQMSSPETRVASLGAAAEPWKLTALEPELRAMGSEVKVRTSEAARAGAATSQPAEVVLQVVRAVVSNALDACRAKPGSTGVVVEVDAAGDQATLRVIDDGVGMPAAAVAAAFDPFFSTKAEGKGMGLGLFLARAHLRKLGGTIELQSEIGRGTTATVRFPLREALRGATGGRGASTGGPTNLPHG
jgi:two-component system sensor histidine kinase RegB